MGVWIHKTWNFAYKQYDAVKCEHQSSVTPPDVTQEHTCGLNTPVSKWEIKGQISQIMTPAFGPPLFAIILRYQNPSTRYLGSPPPSAGRPTTGYWGVAGRNMNAEMLWPEAWQTRARHRKIYWWGADYISATERELHQCVNNTALLWPPYGIGHAIIFLPCGFFYLSSSFFSLNLSGRRVDDYHTSTHGVALVRI